MFTEHNNQNKKKRLNKQTVCFYGTFPEASNVFLNHSHAPAAKMERSGAGAQGPALPRRKDPRAWPARPGSEQRRASARAAPQGSPEPRAPLPQPARRAETERWRRHLPHSAAPKAPDRAPGRSRRPAEPRRAPVHGRHSAQSSSKQRKAADRHSHGHVPPTSKRKLHLPPHGSSPLQAGLRPHPARPGGEQFPPAAGSGAPCRAGPGAKFKAGRRGRESSSKVGGGLNRPGAALGLKPQAGYRVRRCGRVTRLLSCLTGS